jgi:hypothetical protein
MEAVYIVNDDYDKCSSLCRSTSQTMHGPPFSAVQATPIDLFPHTEHCEVVITFERIATMTTPHTL